MTLMGHVLLVLNEGISASLTGGYYFNPCGTKFNNRLQLFLWIVLFAMPVALSYMILKHHRTLNTNQFYICAIIYVSVIAAIFLAVKLIVLHMHHLFDLHDQIVVNVPNNKKKKKQIPTITFEQAPPIVEQLSPEIDEESYLALHQDDYTETDTDSSFEEEVVPSQINNEQSSSQVMDQNVVRERFMSVVHDWSLKAVESRMDTLTSRHSLLNNTSQQPSCSRFENELPYIVETSPNNSMSSLTSSSSFPVNPVPSAATDMVNETHRQAISPPPNTSANTYYQPDEKIYNSKECILTSSKPIAYAIPSSDLEKANQIVRIHHHVISCKHQEDADAATGKKTISTNKFFPIRRAQSFKTLSYEEKVNPLVRIPSRRAPNVMSMEQLSERIPFIVNSTPNIHIAFSKESPVSIIEETSESSFVRRKYLINKNISVVEDNVFGQVLRLVANKDLLTYMKCEDEASLEMRQRMLEFLIVIEKKHSDIFIDPNLKRSEKYNGIIYKGRIPNMEEVRAVESNKYALKIINQRLNLFGDQPSSSTATPSTGGSMVDWERLNEVLIPTYEYSIPSVEYCLDFLRTVIIYRKFIHRDICIKKMSRDMNKEERFVYDVALTTENNFNRDSARLEKEIMVMIDIYNEFKDVPDTRVRHSFCPGLDREVYRRIDLECQQQEIQRIQAERLEREQRNFQNTVASATLFNMLNTGGETVQEMLEDLLPPEIKNRDITPLCGPYRNDRFNSAYHMKTIAERLMDDAEITPDMIISNFQTYNRPQILNDDVQIEYYEMVLCPKGLLGIHKCKLIDEETNLPTWCGRRFRFKMYYNRLSMAELFDKNKHIYSCFFDALVACVISIAALVLVKREIFTGKMIYGLAFVTAGAQYSLLKSVQPDPSSPAHGFNWQTTYSRAYYFILTSSLILGVDIFNEYILKNYKYSEHYLKATFDIGIQNVMRNSTLLLEFATMFLINLPILATLSTLPQISTGVMHFFEQTNLHIFGGTGSFTIVSSLISVLQSLFCVSGLSFVGYLAYSTSNTSTQTIWFSVYVSLIVSVSYLASRYSSDFKMLFTFYQYLFGIKTPKVGDSLNNSNSDENVASCCVLESLVRNTNVWNLDHDDGKEEEGSDGNMIEMQPFARTRSDQHNVNLGINKKCKSTHFANILKIYWIRFQHDIFAFFFITIFFFGLHRTAIFNTEKVFIERLFCILGIVFGFCNHYFYPSLRMKNPWGIFRDPLLKSKEYDVFESQNQTPVAYYETIHIWMLYFERNIIYPCLIISLCSNYAWEHPLYPPIVTAFAAFKLCRTAYSQPNTLYCPLFYTYICINFDLKAYPAAAQCRLLVFFILTILWIKLKEFILKASFIFTYNAPWQITWGSAFHAFVQPLSVAHSGLTMILVAFSSIISAPLNPFLGSALILISYPRPVKFWEKNYSSENKEDRRPVADLAKSPVTNESNLNGVFYEHLSRQLQTYLAGDVLMGRWGTKVEQGDFFVLASLNLNCLVHIIEKGNGFITFQVRGLEFHGTYCQQREVEAISDDPNINDACYCWNANCFPACLNFRAACNVRWSAWQVAAAKYVIDGYSVTDNSVIGILNSVEYRRIFITLIVKCFIFYTFNSGKLAEWMQDSKIKEDLELKSDPKFIENDSNHFSASFDQDYDKRKIGVTRAIFTAMYKKWIRYVKKQTEEVFYSKDLKVIADHSTLITLCFSISIAGRRILAATSYSNISNITESLLYGIHSLLKEDVQVDNKNDAWVLHDKDFVEQVFSPSVRLALKLLQDYFKELDDFDNISVLYERILSYKDRIFISHEHDPKWRSAIMSNVPSLLTIRQVYEDGQNDYKLIMLNKMFLNMRVIKINRECVRAFWAGQQQELIFMKNRNPERGSIQNAKQVLRNMINSSADQPVGYPIYVSPLTTSYIESHNQFKGIIDKSFTINTIFTFFRNLFESITSKILNSSSRNVNNSNTNVNSARYQGNEVNISLNTTTRRSSIKHDIEAGEHVISARAEQNSSQSSAKSTIRNNSFANENVVLRVLPGDESNSANKVYHCIETNPSATHSKSIIVETLQDHQIPHAKKKQSSCSSTGTDEISKEIHNEMVGKYAMIKDQNFIFKTLNEKIKALNRYLVTWPEEEWRLKGGTTGWEYFPKNRAYGQIVHVWVPFHLEPLYRSHAGTIYLIKIVDEQPSDDPLNSRKLSISLNISEKVMYVPINAEGAQIITNIEEYKKIVEEEAKQLPTEDEPTISIIESTTPSLVSVKYVKEKPSIVLRSSNESGFPKISAVTSLTPLSENSDVTINMPQEEKGEEGKS